jgi:hypothetical protein
MASQTWSRCHALLQYARPGDKGAVRGKSVHQPGHFRISMKGSDGQLVDRLAQLLRRHIGH